MPPPLNHRSPTPGTPIVQASPFRWRENHRKAGAKTRGKQWDSNAYHSTGERDRITGMTLAPGTNQFNPKQYAGYTWNPLKSKCQCVRKPWKKQSFGETCYVFVCVCFWVPFWRCLNKTWDGNRKPFQLWLGKRGSQAENNWILLGFIHP